MYNIELCFVGLTEIHMRHRLKQKWGKLMASALRDGTSKLSKTKLWEPLPERIVDEIA